MLHTSPILMPRRRPALTDSAGSARRSRAMLELSVSPSSSPHLVMRHKQRIETIDSQDEHDAIAMEEKAVVDLDSNKADHKGSQTSYEYGDDSVADDEQQSPSDAQKQPSISVYAKLPDIVDVWGWTMLLAFPIDSIKRLQLSHKPYKWIRYATGVVLGAEGNLRMEADQQSDLIDYDADEEDLCEAMNLYYYYNMPDITTERMLPIDPSFVNANRTTTTTYRRMSSFRKSVGRRDGNRCVITGEVASLCNAAHLVSSTKGDLVCVSSQVTVLMAVYLS